MSNNLKNGEARIQPPLLFELCRPFGNGIPGSGARSQESASIAYLATEALREWNPEGGIQEEMGS